MRKSKWKWGVGRGEERVVHHFIFVSPGGGEPLSFPPRGAHVNKYPGLGIRMRMGFEKSD